MGDSLVAFVQWAFRTGRVPKESNETLNCLLPKIENPKHLLQIQPISLCNMTTKLISKILANRV